MLLKLTKISSIQKSSWIEKYELETIQAKSTLHRHATRLRVQCQGVGKYHFNGIRTKDIAKLRCLLVPYFPFYFTLYVVLTVMLATFSLLLVLNVPPQLYSSSLLRPTIWKTPIDDDTNAPTFDSLPLAIVWARSYALADAWLSISIFKSFSFV